MFVDLHTHILFGVDDGSKDIETSLAMLKKEVAEGVSHVVLTPHVQSKVQKVSRDIHLKHFLELKEAVLKEDIPIKLSLGAEVLYRSHLSPNYQDYTFGNSKYILIEFSTREPQPVEEIIYDISRMGFIPIIAHVERYPYVSLRDIEMIRKTGALIQVNTTSVLGLDKAVKAKQVLKMFKLGLVDLVSSDCHNLELRSPNLSTCYKVLQKHVDQAMLDVIFKDNPKKIIDVIS